MHCPDERWPSLLVALSGLAPAPAVQVQQVFEVGFDTETSWEQQLLVFVSELTLRAIGASEGELLLHAGAVCDERGAVAVLCGRSGSGKSTLTTRLTQSGLAYLTDETVRLDPLSLRVTPFRRPALLKAGSHRLLPELRPEGSLLGTGAWALPPAALGGASVPDVPLLPRLLVFPRYDRTARGCDVEMLPPGQAAFSLGEQSSRLRMVRGGPLPALARLARRAPAYRLRFGDGVEATSVVRQLLAAA